jgi:hypothetical protein
MPGAPCTHERTHTHTPRCETPAGYAVLAEQWCALRLAASVRPEWGTSCAVVAAACCSSAARLPCCCLSCQSVIPAGTVRRSLDAPVSSHKLLAGVLSVAKIIFFSERALSCIDSVNARAVYDTSYKRYRSPSFTSSSWVMSAHEAEVRDTRLGGD